MEAFRDWIQHEMEERLDKLPDLGYEDEPVEHVKIAVTAFAFKNAEIIHLLKERGEVIKNEQWEKMPEIDQKINHHKNENFSNIVNPCSIFMTFENEEGVNRALSYDEAIEADDSLEDMKKWLDNHEIEIQPASEPSDIIWENRHFTIAQRFSKSIIAWIIILLLLAVSFIAIFLCSQYSVNTMLKYPIVDCTNLN